MSLLRPFFFVLFAATCALGQTTPAEIDYEAIRLSRNVRAVRTDERIQLDGRLDEASWKAAPPASDFLQWSPRHGEPSPERTEVRFLYDNDNLYVGFSNFDSEIDRVLVKELKEDFNFQESDNVGVLFDSLHDRRSAFSFGVNAAGAKRDQQITNDSQFNMDWDGVWDAKVSRNEEAWFVEIMIPFKTLRFSDSPQQEWGVNMNRRILRRNEESLWSLTPTRYRISRVSQAGTLLGLESIQQGRNLKVTPYVTAGVTQLRAPSGELQTLKSLERVFCTDRHRNCGYNGGVDVKYSLTSSLTLDATYRTDFAQVEVDQQQVNLTRFNLFFPEKRDFFIENAGTFNFGSSNSNLVPFFSRRIGLSDAGTPIPIIGGTRVTGQIDRYDVGFIAMRTDDLDTTPANNYVVGRVKRNLFRNSWIGSLVTSRDSTAPGDYNRVFGADAHFQFYQRLEFDAYMLKSQTPGQSGRDGARRFQTAWRDEELVISAEYNNVQSNFNPEVGFVRRGANSQYAGEFAWRPLLRNSDLIRNLNFSTNLDYYEGSETGQIETRTQEAAVGVQFENSGSLEFSVNRTFDRLAESFTIRRANPQVSIAAGDYTYSSYGMSANSGQTRRFSVSGSFSNGEFWDGRRKSLGAGFKWSPSARFGVDMSYSRNRLNFPMDRAFTTELFGSRFVYAFSPRAFLNAFIQYNADTRQVSSNIRLDFIHHPLSHLYVVYNDRRDTVSGQLLERALILKLTNLFNF
jgi:opacity protein-like surface antigen